MNRLVGEGTENRTNTLFLEAQFNPSVPHTEPLQALNYQGCCALGLCFAFWMELGYVKTVGAQKSGHNGSLPCKRFQNSWSNFSAHNICIGFAPCAPNHPLIPPQTTCTNSAATASIFLKPPAPVKPKGNREEGWVLLAQFLPGIWPKFLLLPPDCLSP